MKDAFFFFLSFHIFKMGDRKEEEKVVHKTELHHGKREIYTNSEKKKVDQCQTKSTTRDREGKQGKRKVADNRAKKKKK